MKVWSVRRMLIAAIVIVSGGCYSAHEPEFCPPPPDCFSEATTVCADEITNGHVGDEGCTTFEIVGSGTGCDDSSSRVHVTIRAEGAMRAFVQATVEEVPPGVVVSGCFLAETLCGQCGPGVMSIPAEPGHEFGGDYQLRDGVFEAWFLGDGVVYSVEFCPWDDQDL